MGLPFWRGDTRMEEPVERVGRACGLGWMTFEVEVEGPGGGLLIFWGVGWTGLVLVEEASDAASAARKSASVPKSSSSSMLVRIGYRMSLWNEAVKYRKAVVIKRQLPLSGIYRVDPSLLLLTNFLFSMTFFCSDFLLWLSHSTVSWIESLRVVHSRSKQPIPFAQYSGTSGIQKTDSKLLQKL